MIAFCEHAEYKKNGRDANGNQRYKCLDCGKNFGDDGPKPLGGIRIDHAKGVLALRMILEGSSVRSTSRITGLHKNTIIKMVVLVGNRCERMMAARIKGMEVKDVQVDETWGFVGCKRKTAERKLLGEEFGDAYTFIAIERNTKLVLAYHIGKRDGDSTTAMLEKLDRATCGRFQLSTDAFREYRYRVPFFLRKEVDHATLAKVYGTNRERGVDPGTASRYSPADIISTSIRLESGDPDAKRVCTSHVERLNLNIRMANRRMTRLTNAFSKKLENHEAAMSLYFAYYNFCRVHGTLKTAPAVAAGLIDKPWSIDRLLEDVASFS